jgi:hypothetical protein
MQWFGLLIVAAISIFGNSEALRANIALIKISRHVMMDFPNGSDCGSGLVEYSQMLDRIQFKRAQSGYRAIAFILNQQGCSSASESALRLALERDSSSWLSAGLLGIELENQGRLLEAEPYLQRGGLGLIVAWRRVDYGRAAILEKDYPSAARWLEASCGNYDAAVQAGREAIRVHNPVPVELRYEFGSVLWRAVYVEEDLTQWLIALRTSLEDIYRPMIPPEALRLLQEGIH